MPSWFRLPGRPGFRARRHARGWLAVPGKVRVTRVPFPGSLSISMRPLVRLGDRPADGQAQAVSPGPPAAGGIDPVEPVEDAGQVLRGDADSRIGDDEARLASSGIRPGGAMLPPGRRELDRVVQQVEEEAAELLLVAQDPAGR